MPYPINSVLTYYIRFCNFRMGKARTGGRTQCKLNLAKILVALPFVDGEASFKLRLLAP